LNKNLLNKKGEVLPLMEHYYTIQGEGHYTGRAAYFIRLGGCDVGCHWCDVKESWNASKHPHTSVDKIVRLVMDSQSAIAVITGGEPAMYDLSDLTKQLRKNKVRTHIETSGAYSLTGTWDWICLSPKKTKPPVKEVFKHANELKMIIYNKDDFKWAEKNAKKINKKCKLFLQPEWSKSHEILPMVIDYIKKHPQWQISLQTHKYMNIP
jgi:7-carboxy-7-deazaguanine synthase